MPLPNELFGRSLVNLGPLTSTYTLPDDCATPTNVYLVAADEIGTGAIWQSECSTEELATVKWRSTCFPSGSALDSIYRSADLDLPAQTILAYFSPGIACPDAWVTVGVAVKDDKGEISSSGQFVIPDVLATAPVPPYNPAPNIFMDAIENGETVAICCPSNFVADPNGLCYSTMARSAYPGTEGCQIWLQGGEGETTTATYDYYGSTVTGDIVEQPTWTTTSIESTTFPAANRSDYVAVAFTEKVTIIHKEADLSQQDEDDGATPGRLGVGSKIGIMMTVWSMAVAAGVFLLIRF